MPTPVRHTPRPVQKSVSIFYVIAFVLLIVVGGAYAGLYFYRSGLTASIAEAKKSLKLAEGSFEPEAISDLQLFDKRVIASKQVLASHIILSPFFDLLSSLTLPSVQFNGFNISVGSDGKNFVVKMSGLAKDYRSIAIQAQTFNSNEGKYFKDVVFSNLTLSDEKENKGYVSFDISFYVDPVLMSYEKQILNYLNKKPTTQSDSKLTPLEEVDAFLNNANADEDVMSGPETKLNNNSNR